MADIRSDKTLEFFFDFGSPNAYLAYAQLPGLLERTGGARKLEQCPCATDLGNQQSGRSLPILSQLTGQIHQDLRQTQFE